MFPQLLLGKQILINQERQQQQVGAAVACSRRLDSKQDHTHVNRMIMRHLLVVKQMTNEQYDIQPDLRSHKCSMLFDQPAHSLQTCQPDLPHPARSVLLTSCSHD